jgi:MFS family permease
MFTPHLRICLAAFLFDGAVMTGLIATPFFVYNQLGGGAGMSGLFGAGQAITYALTCMAMSGRIDRARNGLHWALAGIACFSVLFCMMPFFRAPWICLAVTGVAWCFLALTWPALHSWVGAEPDPARRTRHMGWFNLSWSAGFAVSPLLAGPLIDTDYRLAFVLIFALSGGAFLLILSLPHEKDYFAVLTAEALGARADHDRASEAHLYCAWAATCVANLLAGVLRAVYPKRIDDLVAAGELRIFFEETPLAALNTAAATRYSWLAFFMSLATAAAFLLLGRSNWWRHNFGLLCALQAAGAAAFWFLGHTRSMAVMLVCFAVIGAIVGVTFFMSVYYSVSNPLRKHSRATINEGVVGFGAFAGSMVFGQLAAAYGIALPFHYTPAAMILVLLFQWWLLRHGTHRSSQIKPAT